MEGAARVFAGEYSGSTLSVQDHDSGSPAWVVTPGGAWCRFLFLSGALTEVTEIGDMVHTRIADPTGVFNLVIGGRNTALAETFCRLPVPVFVTVTGRAQMYTKNGEVMLSVRPDNCTCCGSAGARSVGAGNSKIDPCTPPSYAPRNTGDLYR